MCLHGRTVTVAIAGQIRDIDSCLAGLVEALNNAGITTVASCCGHGHRPGNIALRDGRELIIAPSFSVARMIDAAFPTDIHGDTIPENTEPPEENSAGG